MADQRPDVFGGVDTHADTHHAAVVDPIGRHLGDAQFPTTSDGYRALLAWLHSFGTVLAIGVEGTGSYGTQLARVLAAAGLKVFDVNRPDRRMRRQLGKSDPIDAYAAAEAVASGRAAVVPKTHTGAAEDFASCTTPAPRPSRPARRPSTKSAASWSPRPTPCAPNCAGWQQTS